MEVGKDMEHYGGEIRDHLKSMTLDSRLYVPMGASKGEKTTVSGFI